MRFFIRVFSNEVVFFFSAAAALALCVPTFGAFFGGGLLVAYGRLGLALGSPGLVGPPWTRDRFGCFFGSPLWRPKWSHGFCRNAQKHMGLGLLMRKGRLAESLHASLSVPKATVFSNVFANFGGHLLVQNELVGAELGVSFSVSAVLFRALCGFFLGALDWVVSWLAPVA